MAEKRLADLLDTGKEWTRLRTSVPGVYVLKLPAYNRAPSRLAVELNPLDGAGNPTKRRGLVLRTGAELEAFNELYDHDKLSKLLELLDGINRIKTDKGRREEPIIEL
jgi:hypothetical protein